jgi:hypothetical protein
MVYGHCRRPISEQAGLLLARVRFNFEASLVLERLEFLR